MNDGWRFQDLIFEGNIDSCEFDIVPIQFENTCVEEKPEEVNCGSDLSIDECWTCTIDENTYRKTCDPNCENHPEHPAC